MPRQENVLSILQGAYGDYYEQAVCLKHLALTNPQIRLKLYTATISRYRELSVLDFSFADCFRPLVELAPDEPVDRVFQFHAKDAEFLADVVPNLPPSVASKLDLNQHLLPWRYLRKILPLKSQFQLGLSESGRARLPEVEAANRIPASIWKRPTIGFLWRYRSSGAVRPWLQQDKDRLREKYSRILNRAIEEFDCHVLVCGMNVKTTEENRERTDCKFPDFGLDLPPSRATHLQGLNWALELETLSKTDVCIGHPSGFTEALEIKSPGKTVLVDPLPHYLLKMLRHRMPFFGHRTPGGLAHLWRLRHSEEEILSHLRRRLGSRSHGPESGRLPVSGPAS